jgi:glycosyltransferase involved in cell wall biosynthesis
LGVYKIKKNFKNIKIVLESHGDFINTLELERNLLFPNVYKKLFLKMASYTIKNADILRAVSSSTEEQALSFDTSKRVVRFPAWIDFEIFSNIQPTRSDEGNFKILFIGSITDRKKPHLIIEALPKLHDDKVELHLVGPTPNHKYLDDLREKIISNNLEDRVYIHGTKSRDEVKEFYSESNLMILPSVSEGLARVIFESQVTACPVLVTDAPGMQDIVIDGQTGYVFESNDLKTMIEKIDYIIKNYSEASAVGKNAKDFILSNYSADNFKFSFQKIFDTV